jgi:hypothetical protein
MHLSYVEPLNTTPSRAGRLPRLPATETKAMLTEHPNIGSRVVVPSFLLSPSPLTQRRPLPGAEIGGPANSGPRPSHSSRTVAGGQTDHERPAASASVLAAQDLMGQLPTAPPPQSRSLMGELCLTCTFCSAQGASGQRWIVAVPTGGEASMRPRASSFDFTLNLLTVIASPLTLG